MQICALAVLVGAHQESEGQGILMICPRQLRGLGHTNVFSQHHKCHAQQSIDNSFIDCGRIYYDFPKRGQNLNLRLGRSQK